MSAQVHGATISGKATAAIAKFKAVIVSATADFFTQAGAADTKIVGMTITEAFNASDPVTVKLFGGGTFVGTANEAVVRGDFIEILANGFVGAGATATEFVALTGGGAGEYVEFCKVGDLIA